MGGGSFGSVSLDAAHHCQRFQPGVAAAHGGQAERSLARKAGGPGFLQEGRQRGPRSEGLDDDVQEGQ
eukprot:6147292-Lingulodinium_polyedra.AAC.1